MSRLFIVAAVTLLAAVSVSPSAEASGFEETFGTFQLNFGPEIPVDGGSAIAVVGEITDSGGGPWTGSISGWLALDRERLGECDYSGEWTIARENAAPLVERVNVEITECSGVVAGIPHLFGSSRAQSGENGKIVGFRSFDGALNPALDAVSGTWSGRFRAP